MRAACLCSVVPSDSARGRRHGERLLRLLPRGKEHAHHGVVQAARAAGLCASGERRPSIRLTECAATRPRAAGLYAPVAGTVCSANQ